MNLYLIDNKNYLLEKNYSNNLNTDYTSVVKYYLRTKRMQINFYIFLVGLWFGSSTGIVM